MIVTEVNDGISQFAVSQMELLNPTKFQDAARTIDGTPRAHVSMHQIETLWINTGTLCNLACKTCYIESSPTNDALIYLTLAEVDAYLDQTQELGTHAIGFTGGEPFMNPDIMAMIRSALVRGFEVLVLTNAMQPMRRFEERLCKLRSEIGARLTFRVSLDHYTSALHEAERGAGSWAKAIGGCKWLSDNNFRLAVAGRQMPDEYEEVARAGYAELFAKHNLSVDAFDPSALTLFPALNATNDVPEISELCWELLGISPMSLMCASSRMVIKRKGAQHPTVVACTLIPYDDRFVLGEALVDTQGAVSLNHPHCARFCVLGGSSCSG